jgi:hypothetical protein
MDGASDWHVFGLGCANLKQNGPPERQPLLYVQSVAPIGAGTSSDSGNGGPDPISMPMRLAQFPCHERGQNLQ